MDKLLFIMIVIFLLIVNIHLQANSSIFTSSNKTIWMYWEQGEEKINNSYIKMCINGWKRLNPNWNIRVLNYNTALQYIPELKNYNHLIVQMRSDVLRLKLLEKYGGVWVDVTLLPMKPLDTWLSSATKKSGIFFYREERWDPNIHGTVSNWFIATENKRHPLIQKWSTKFLENIKNAKNLKPKKWSKDYFLCHHSLDQLYKTDTYIKQTLDTLNKNSTNIRSMVHKLPIPELTCDNIHKHSEMYKRYGKITNNTYNKYLKCFTQKI